MAFESYYRRFLNDSSQAIWTNAYLLQMELEAEDQVAQNFNCIVDRFSLEITADQALYQIPENSLGIRFIRWFGKLVRPLTMMEIRFLFPDNYQDSSINLNGAFLSTAFNNRAFLTNGSSQNQQGSYQGRPEFYGFSGTDFRTIQFYGTPSESVPEQLTGLWDLSIPIAVIVEYYRLPDGANFKIPVYVRKALLKNYVLFRAFGRNGPGQRLDLSNYYKQKFEVLLETFKTIYTRIQEGQIYQYADTADSSNGYRPRAVYPLQYGYPEYL